jgi:enoyl-CoA hydratase
MTTDSSDRKPEDGAVHLHRDGAVATVVFDRPRARNAMTWVMYNDMGEICDKLADDSEIRTVVFRGAGGKAFVAGTDIGQFSAFTSGDDGLDYESRIAEYVAGVANLPQPTIAVVEGWAVGGGMAIASVCDFRIATPGARFGVPIARTLGNCLAAGNLRVLVAMLGLPMVKRMLLLADMVPAEELTANGYIHAIATLEELDDVVGELCGRLAGHAPVTIAGTKTVLSRLVNEGDNTDEDVVRQVYGSADFKEGVSAFVAKRLPVWKGR